MTHRINSEGETSRKPCSSYLEGIHFHSVLKQFSFSLSHLWFPKTTFPTLKATRTVTPRGILVWHTLALCSRAANGWHNWSKMACIRRMLNVIIRELTCSYKRVKTNTSTSALLTVSKCKYTSAVIVRVATCCEKLNFFFSSVGQGQVEQRCSIDCAFS